MKKVTNKITLAMLLLVGTMAANAQVNNHSAVNQNTSAQTSIADGLAAPISSKNQLASPFMRNLVANTTPSFGNKMTGNIEAKSATNIQNACNIIMRKTRFEMNRQKYILKW